MSQAVSQTDVSNFISGTYGWMSIAIGITAFSSFILGNSAAFMSFATTPFGIVSMLIFYFASFFFAITTATPSFARAEKDNTISAFAFLIFSVSVAALLTPMIYSYSAGVVVSAFGISAITFALSSLIGFTTKYDLTESGSFLMMTLIGLIIAMVFNIFIGSNTLGLIINLLLVVVFAAITSWDTQKIKEAAENGGRDQTMMLMALNIYVNFFNIFSNILQLMEGDTD